MSLLTLISLLFPGSILEPMWSLNPGARQGFKVMGAWAILLMGVVSMACAAAALGLLRGASWGHRLALLVLAVNLIGDIANVVLGTQPKAIIGVPIVLALVGYLFTKRVRRYFSNENYAEQLT